MGGRQGSGSFHSARAHPVNAPLLTLAPSNITAVDLATSVEASDSVESERAILCDRRHTTEEVIPTLQLFNTLQEGWAKNFRNYCKSVEDVQLGGDTTDSRRIYMIPKWITSAASADDENECKYWLDKCLHVFFYHWHGIVESSPLSLVVGYLCLSREENSYEICRFFVERVQCVVDCWHDARMYLLASGDANGYFSVVLVPSGLQNVFGWELTRECWEAGNLPPLEDTNLLLACNDVFKNVNRSSVGMDSNFSRHVRSFFGNRVPFLHVPCAVNLFNLSVLSYLLGLISDSQWCRDIRVVGDVRRDIGVHFLMGSEFMVFLNSNCPTRAAQRLSFFGNIVNMGANFRHDGLLKPGLGMIMDTYATVQDLDLVKISIEEQTQSIDLDLYILNLHPYSRRTVLLCFVLFIVIFGRDLKKKLFF
jgi:hypothetical protein